MTARIVLTAKILERFYLTCECGHAGADHDDDYSGSCQACDCKEFYLRTHV